MDNQEDKNVWIDRQEYERLKALEAQPQPAPVAASGDVAAGATAQPLEGAPAKTSVSVLTILTGAFAVISFVYPPLVLIFLGLGVASLIRLFRKKRQDGMPLGLGLVLGLGIVAFLFTAGPFILLVGFFIMWQIGCWTGLGSCTTA